MELLRLSSTIKKLQLEIQILVENHLDNDHLSMSYNIINLKEKSKNREESILLLIFS